MKTVTINVLASDFTKNSYHNYGIGMSGCPMERAFTRALGDEKSGYYAKYLNWDANHPQNKRVRDMFLYKEPIQDFSFDITINE